jgi:hypothetical protein
MIVYFLSIQLYIFIFISPNVFCFRPYDSQISFGETPNTFELHWSMNEQNTEISIGIKVNTTTGWIGFGISRFGKSMFGNKIVCFADFACTFCFT